MVCEREKVIEAKERDAQRKKNKRGMGRNNTVKSEVYQVQLVGLEHFKTSSATDSAFSVFSYPLRVTKVCD